MKPPWMKNVIVTSCSHSHGRPAMRVTMSHTTVTVKPVMATPQSTISARSTRASARPLRWRCDCSTREIGLLYVADEAQDLDRVRPELLGELVLDRLAHRLEARLVDAGDDLHAHLLELGARLLLHLESLRRLHLVHFIGGRLHPLLLVGVE